MVTHPLIACTCVLPAKLLERDRAGVWAWEDALPDPEPPCGR